MTELCHWLRWHKWGESSILKRLTEVSFCLRCIVNVKEHGKDSVALGVRVLNWRKTALSERRQSHCLKHADAFEREFFGLIWLHRSHRLAVFIIDFIVVNRLQVWVPQEVRHDFYQWSTACLRKQPIDRYEQCLIPSEFQVFIRYFIRYNFVFQVYGDAIEKLRVRYLAVKETGYFRSIPYLTDAFFEGLFPLFVLLFFPYFLLFIDF